MSERRLPDCHWSVHGKNGSLLMEKRASMLRLIRILDVAMSEWPSEARSA